MLPASTNDLRELARQDPPAWSRERLLEFDEERHAETIPFTFSETWCAQASINVFEVVGTRNSSYFGWSWLRLLEEGKRMKRNLTLYRQNPAYYLQTAERQPSMGFLTYDGRRLFVGGDGNHRTCIARFAFDLDGRTHLHAVTLQHCEVDWQLMKAFQGMKHTIVRLRLPVSVAASRSACGREDAAGWKRDRFDPFILLTEHRARGTERRLGLDAAEEWLKHYSQPWLARWFRRSPR